MFDAKRHTALIKAEFRRLGIGKEGDSLRVLKTIGELMERSHKEGGLSEEESVILHVLERKELSIVRRSTPSAVSQYGSIRKLRGALIRELSKKKDPNHRSPRQRKKQGRK